MSPELTALRNDVLRDVQTRMLLAGAWQTGGGGTFAVSDPGDGEVVAEVADANVEDALVAVDAADNAFPTWSRTPPRRRAEILRRGFDLMMARAETIAQVIAVEGGKPLAEARAEVAYAAEFLRWFSEEAVRIGGDFYRAPGGDKQIIVLQQPVGIAYFITPWNFPAAMATRKIGPALAAGCTVVLKPAKETPLTALLLGQLFQEAGLPDGVLNILPTTQSRAITAALLEDPRVRKLSLTGSTETGRMLLAQAAQNIVKCSMELGGNAPFIVLEDADMDTAVQAAMVAKTRNGGQSCTAANRFYVHRDRVEAFSERFAHALGALKVGHGLASAIDLGPVIDRHARDRLRRLVDLAVEEGATVLTPDQDLPGLGHFVAPTLLAGVRPDASILREEIFGPVAPVVPFDDEEEVLALANDTPMGLVGFVATRDLGRALRIGERLECGMVGVNRGVVSDPAAPFGGWKQSGLGREGGKVGIEDYLETKYIAASW